MSSVILGCGDIGRRIALALIAQGHRKESIVGLVKSVESEQRCFDLGINTGRFDLDGLHSEFSCCHGAELYYTVAPPKQGVADTRSHALLSGLDAKQFLPSKVVVISTTGLYGDCHGAWVDENSPIQAQTQRAKRRSDAEQQWLNWGHKNSVAVCILRVPGIYAFSRLPRSRIENRTPVVNPQECGYTNRIHADDLAQINLNAMRYGRAGEVYNATDGTPGKISDYLQQAAKMLGVDALPEISMQQAQQQLSQGMLSYLGESRKISNRKMLKELKIVLRYPDYLEGLKN
jgi:nucleoside-diphosphate-sugar epimerase